MRKVFQVFKTWKTFMRCFSVSRHLFYGVGVGVVLGAALVAVAVGVGVGG